MFLSNAMKKSVLLFLSIFFIASAFAQFGYVDPTIPKLESPVIATSSSGGGSFINGTSICVYQSEYVVYDEAGAPPAGFFPYGNAVTVLARGYPVLYNMEVVAVTFSSTTNVECMGADATTNNTCKVGIVYNQSGVRNNPFNITLNNELQKTVSTSINLTNGDQILVLGYGNTVGNASTRAISGSIVQFEARTINCSNINFNVTASGGGGNASFNQTLTDTLYAGIEWDYNQTSPAIAYADATFLRITENSTIARAGSSTANCAAGLVAQNITVVTNSSGVFVTSWQCVPDRVGGTNLSNWSQYPAVSNVQMGNLGLINLGLSNITGNLNFFSGANFNFINPSGVVGGTVNLVSNAFRISATNGTSVVFDSSNNSFFYFNSFRTTADFVVDYLLGNAIYVNGTTGLITFTPNITAPNICYSNGINCTSSGSTFNATYNNMINTGCPSPTVVNGTYPNGTFICVSPTFITTNISYINNTEVFTGQKTFNSSTPTKIDGAQLDMDENAINFTRWGIVLNASFFNGTEVGNAFQIMARDGTARILMFSRGTNSQFVNFNGTEFRILQNANSKLGFYTATSTVNNNPPLEFGGFYSSLEILSLRANASTNTWDWYTTNASNIIAMRYKMPVVIENDLGVQHLEGLQKPTILNLSGAGGSPTVSIQGTDLAGLINVTTGSLPTLSADIFRVDFARAYGNNTYVVFSPANTNSALLSGTSMIFVTSNSTSFRFTAGSAALTGATNYLWTYHVIGD